MGALSAFFLVPWLYRRVIMDDWELKAWDLVKGPLLLRRGEVPPRPDGIQVVQDYYRGHKTMEELQAERAAGNDEESDNSATKTSHEGSSADPKDESRVLVATQTCEQNEVIDISGPRPEGKWFMPSVMFWALKKALFRGIEKDVVGLQKKRNILSGDIEKTHAHASHYDNRAEYMFSFLQVLTACTASFTHGANDVAKYVPPSFLLRVVR